MSLYLLTFLLALADGFYLSNQKLEKEKIGGGNYTDIRDIPYQASIIISGSADCGASIISRYYLLTAAHCVVSEHDLKVRTGASFVNEPGNVHEIENVLVQKYNPVNFDNDIALIKLKYPLTFNAKQKPIQIARPTDIPKPGQNMTISGFGDVGYNVPSNRLKIATVTVVDQKTCYNAYKSNPVTDNMFCATTTSADACNHDSGGPGVINGKLYGIVNSGVGCKLGLFPAVYTRVHKYYNWIINNSDLIDDTNPKPAASNKANPYKKIEDWLKKYFPGLLEAAKEILG